MQNHSQVDDNVIEKTTPVGVQIHLIVLVIFNAKYFNRCGNVALNLSLTVLKGVCMLVFL